uniref:Large ribosomal subunit protein mL49 n=1 Tax=Alexandrium catenella TaxID=2925 RepID=A0A7S1PN44_ALECA|mmetsp:Transcript_105986/g.282260  ORF Transcript_105986/g.282260 Transcript_105986/m.282260 type:complete len:220 (+) Transcript_105986:50-709(+)
MLRHALGAAAAPAVAWRAAAGPWASAAALGGRRCFARKRQHQDRPVPVMMSLDQQSQQAQASAPRDPRRDWSNGFPEPSPRVGGFRKKYRDGENVIKPWAHRGATPRLGHLWFPGEGQNHSPFDDPNTPIPGEPLEPERPPPPWKVLRTHNGSLPVYLRVSYQGAVVTTMVSHVFGDTDHMRKELMRICEAPVRERCSRFEIRGQHTWKVKEWLVSLGM